MSVIWKEDERRFYLKTIHAEGRFMRHINGTVWLKKYSLKDWVVRACICGVSAILVMGYWGFANHFNPAILAIIAIYLGLFSAALFWRWGSTIIFLLYANLLLGNWYPHGWSIPEMQYRIANFTTTSLREPFFCSFDRPFTRKSGKPVHGWPNAEWCTQPIQENFTWHPDGFALILLENEYGKLFEIAPHYFPRMKLYDLDGMVFRVDLREMRPVTSDRPYSIKVSLWGGPDKWQYVSRQNLEISADSWTTNVVPLNIAEFMQVSEHGAKRFTDVTYIGIYYMPRNGRIASPKNSLNLRGMIGVDNFGWAEPRNRLVMNSSGYAQSPNT